MHKLLAVVIMVALAGGLLGAVAASQLSSSAGAAPTAQQVREQNVDGSGFIRSHEQGTANVNVTNGSLRVSGTVNVGNFPAAAQGRLIDLGTHNESGVITMPMVNVADCGHISVLAAADGAGSQRVLQSGLCVS